MSIFEIGKCTNSVDEDLGNRTIKHRLNSLGISLEPFIERITFIYHRPKPIGFRFVSKNVFGLGVMLMQNPHFGIDDGSIYGTVAGSQSRGTSIREICDSGSLHFNITRKLSGITMDNCEVHLDANSISKCSNPDGSINYDMQNLPQHLITDLFEVPNLTAHNEGEFFNIGVKW
jgi:hypothetical protein